MPEGKQTIIQLTEEQKQQMREATGTEHQAIKVEVGTRIAPADIGTSALRPGGKGGLRPGGKGGLRPGGKGGLRPG